MFKRKRKPGQPVGTDLDWFVIPIRTIQTWGILLVFLAAAAFLGYTLQSRMRRSPQERAKIEIVAARQLIERASPASANVRPGSLLAQARTFLRGAEDAFARNNYDSAYRLAVESQSYSRRASSGTASEELGDASLIFTQGDVSIQTSGGAAFGPAHMRQSLFDGDFIKTGRTGSAEIMFTDGTLYTIRPGSLFEVRRPASPEAGGSQVKMVSGTVNVYTAASSTTVSTDAATASIERESRVAVDVEKGEKTDVTTYRGKATVSTGKETVVLADREKISAAVRTRQISAKVSVPESPVLVLPPDDRAYDLKSTDEVDLKWSPVTRAARYRIQISRSRLFVPDTTDVDLDDRTGTATRVKISREGSYFWRVAAIDASGHLSDWSAIRRFKMAADLAAAGINRGSPPRLTVSPPQQMGNLFLIYGKTDPGAVVTVNGEPADVDADGSFKKTVTVNREGSAALIVKAVDAAGNETVKQVKVFVESL
ncbi:MAG TPA: FecR domain-containing protein [Thermoanaerobaculia bacterium]|nr:FecR domain-containing protein [Thermoanaerobaculia bacterium]